MTESTYPISSDRTLKVLKALSNEARLRIISLLHDRAMNVSEIARELDISQPTITTYVNQLEEAGLILTRIQKNANGYGKLCFLIHESLTFTFNPGMAKRAESAIVLDMPVGHYAGIEIAGPSLLTSQTRVLASWQDTSRFFHPDRMDADLLFVRDGMVQYLFPYNVPEDRQITRLELSVEASTELARPPLQAEFQLTINGHAFEPCTLSEPRADSTTRHMPGWYPQELPTAGQLLTWAVDHHGAYYNGRPAGEFTLKELGIKGSQPIQVILRVLACSAKGQPRGGLVLYGRNFGRFDQDLRFKIVHDGQ